MNKMFPKEYQNQAFICEHGSWNRTVKIGYRITLVTMQNNKPVDYKVFAEGWLHDNKKDCWGRPVDLCQMPDGAFLVSDEFGGRIFRISYAGKIAGTTQIADLKSAYPGK